MKRKKWGVVIPSNRADKLKECLKAWDKEFKKNKVTVYLIEDMPTKCLLPACFMPGYKIKRYSWTEIDADLKDNAWIIPRKTDGIRSYGFLKAANDKCDYILTIDDDVIPRNNIFKHYEDGFANKVNVSNYIDNGKLLYPHTYCRGYPFKDRGQNADVVIQYGMWDNVPDFDAITQMRAEDKDLYIAFRNVVTCPKGMAITGCIMNCAFTRDAAPLMYQLLMGYKYPFDRWGDIWSGLYAKYRCDELGKAILINGAASVLHTRASNVDTNFNKEFSGYQENENMWQRINEWGEVTTDNSAYNDDIKEARKIWLSLFK